MATYVERDRAYVWHPFMQMKTARAPIPIVRGEGVYLYDDAGKRYLDGIASWWVNLHGHSHPYIVQKIKAQLDQFEHASFGDFTHKPAVDLAERLLAMLPGKMSKVYYSDNGATAVEIALKMAIQYWYNKNPRTLRTKIVCFKGAYHGDTFGAMSAAGKNEFNKPFWKHMFDVEMIDPPLVGHEEESAAQLLKILQQGTTACFIFEPLIMGAGGMIIYPAEGLDRLIELCKQYDVITIADEVMTGFGRTGTLFACEQVNEKVDMFCLSKGLTGGFLPLGVTTCTETIFEAFLGDSLQQAFLHGHSYSGNPLGCSSALASLDLLLSEECARQRAMISNCHAEFCSRWKKHPKLKRCEYKGVILVLEFRTEKSSYFDGLRDRLYYFFLDRGVLLRPLGNVLSVLPPYCISKDELKYIYEHIEQYCGQA